MRFRVQLDAFSGPLDLLLYLVRKHELDALGVPVEYVRQSRRARGAVAVASAAAVLRRRRPDILVSFVYQANVVARLAGTITGVPVIVSSIRNEPDMPRWAMIDRSSSSWITRYLARRDRWRTWRPSTRLRKSLGRGNRRSARLGVSVRMRRPSM